MISRLGKAMLAVLLVLGLSLSGCSVPPHSWTGTQSFTHTSQLLSLDIESLSHMADENGRVTAVIKLEGASLSGVAKEDVVAALKQHAARTQKDALQSLTAMGAAVLNTFWLTNAILVDLPVEELGGLESIPRVERVFENFTVTLPEPLQEEEMSAQPHTVGDVTWGLDEIGAPQVWDTGITGSGVRVAVLDTGVSISHPALAGKMWTDDEDDDTYPGGWAEFDGDGNIVEGSRPHDSGEHGTHVSGTVLGGKARGYSIGVAPGAWLMHALVLHGSDGGTFAQVIAGMQWAVEPFDQYGDPAGESADVINMSLGAEGFSFAMIEPIVNARAAGVVPIASIGNEGVNTSGSPGNVYQAFGIGSTQSDGYVAPFSGGEVIDWTLSHPEPYIKPDFTAPGAAVYSSIPGGQLDYKSGTSMAAPHVAGAVALILEADGTGLTVDEIYGVLMETAVWQSVYSSERPCTRYGWGRIDAYDAVVLAALPSGIEGHVTDADSGDPIEGAKIFCHETGTPRYTDEDGYYKFIISPDTYTLTAEPFGYGAVTFEEIEVVDGEFAEVNFAADLLPTGYIDGTVTYADTGAPIEGASVTLPSTPLSTTTDMDGYYIIEAPIGTHDVRSATPGYQPATALGVEITEGDTITVDFALEIAPWADWRWLYDAPWRPAAESAIGVGDPGVWYGAMRIDLAEDMGQYITAIAYHDSANTRGKYAQVHVAEHVGDFDSGAPGPWLASTDLYYPRSAGWVELALTEPVLIGGIGTYWVVVEIEDPGAGSFPFGVVAPGVDFADLVNSEDPQNPDDWDTLQDFGLNYSWLLEAYVGETYELTIDSTAGGDVTTPGEGKFNYLPDRVANLVAVADEHHRFVEWTGDIDEIDNPTSPNTSITMSGDYSITAVFELVDYTLNISSSEGGSVTVPVEDEFTYPAGTVVELVAEADDDYEFVMWIGDVDEIDDVTSNSTAITMWGDYSITAAFVEYTLTIDSTEGGSVTVPDEGEFTYPAGTVVPLEAVVDEHYRFVGWTGDVDEIDDAGDLKTAITMWDDYSITAVFELVDYTLTIASTENGEVTVPGEGQFSYPAGTVVALQAVADDHCRFVQWTGDVGEAGDTEAPGTTITMWADYSITADFERLPTITTGAATDVTRDSATLSMEFTMGDYSPIEVRFSYKKSADAAWSHTEWIAKTADGSHDRSITELSPGTLYDFKATLSFDGEEITGDTLQFTTDEPPSSCFIATAAYGTDSAVEINILREFRDAVLLPNALGAGFVSFYYTTSPPIADFISQNEFLRTAVRVGFVDQIVRLVSWSYNMWS